MLKIAICDDNIKFATSLEMLIIQESRRIGIRAETEVFSDGDVLLQDMEKGYCYEIIFIDIEMERVNGIDAAHCIRKKNKSVLFIYVSGYDQYLKELFEVEPFRYLSKPLDEQKFCRYFREACERIGENEVFYQFYFNKELHKVALKDTVYFESNNRVVYIFQQDSSREQFYGKLNDVETELSNSRKIFLRIHQSYFVNYDYITSMNFSNVILSFGGRSIKLNISEDRQKIVRKQLCELARGKAVIE